MDSQLVYSLGVLPLWKVSRGFWGDNRDRLGGLTGERVRVMYMSVCRTSATHCGALWGPPVTPSWMQLWMARDVGRTR